MALWYRGYPGQALERVNDALRLARELAHPFSLSVSLSLAARVAQFRREPWITREQSDASILSSAEQGFPFWDRATNNGNRDVRVCLHYLASFLPLRPVKQEFSQIKSL